MNTIRNDELWTILDEEPTYNYLRLTLDEIKVLPEGTKLELVCGRLKITNRIKFMYSHIDDIFIHGKRKSSGNSFVKDKYYLTDCGLAPYTHPTGWNKNYIKLSSADDKTDAIADAINSLAILTDGTTKQAAFDINQYFRN